MGPQELDPAGCRALALALGDTPETVISIHQLRRGLCSAFVLRAASPSGFAAALLQSHDLPQEPVAFGADPEALWELLGCIQGWTCVEVTSTCAPALGALMAARLNRPVRYLPDLYHTLSRPAATFTHTAARLLTPADLPLLEAAPAALRPAGFGNLRAQLAEGINAGAIVNGQLVAIATTYARSERHADIGVATLEDWRGRGYATACASLVAGRFQRGGQIPVWSTGEDNQASRRVAGKLGFTEVLRRTYVILA